MTILDFQDVMKKFNSKNCYYERDLITDKF